MSVDLPRQTATDVVFLTQGWPVQAGYDFDGPDQLVIVPSGPVVGAWAPGRADPGLVADLIALVDAPADELLAWSRQRGPFGIVHPGAGEPVALVRARLAQLAATQRLLTALRLGELAGIGQLTREAAGHLVDPQRLATAAGIDTAPLARASRHVVEAQVAALHGLGTALGQGLRDVVSVDAFLTGSGDDIRLTGAVAGHGPLPTAYLYLLGEAAALRIGLRTGKPRMEWRMPRRCALCSNTFQPNRYDAAWCSDRCRWKASKRGIANPYREADR